MQEIDKNNESNPQILHEKPSSFLMHFPIMFFAAVMGLGGVSLVIFKSINVFNLTQLKPLYYALAIFSLFVLALIIILYLAKIIKYPQNFKAELKHPVRINFFAAVSIGIMIVLMLFVPLLPLIVNKIIFYFAAFLQIVFSIYVVQYWFINEMKQKMASPAWFIPIVGNLIVPLTGMNINTFFQSAVIDFSIMLFYFGMGTFFWILLNAGLLFRLIFGENLPQKFLPTLFIFIAPPSVFALDILSLFNGFITQNSLFIIAASSFSVALFFVFLMLSIFKVFYKLNFALSWWAFTFPTSAFTLCALELYHLSASWLYLVCGIFGIIISILAVIIVAFKTLIAIKNREICVLES